MGDLASEEQRIGRIAGVAMLGQPARELAQAQQSAPTQEAIPDGPKRSRRFRMLRSRSELPIGPVTPGAGTTADSNGATTDEAGSTAAEQAA
jgi:hypothetical protein